ncbi:hypothetical protein GFY24_37845 [Nocardia sp. SYP-A9097]|uniref:hypothetical protein n=1 Tax=Nocardia sp. SYP-A9097 TaxID=2663237 RepID=UPI00129BC283|nr:hypothetical protein [Nocardia sp. SYP-A9097]MRH93120.1 hypothetical protein [Nocardia sp. SYP-A9097]
MTLDEVAAELYGVPPAEFVAARTERAKQARESGDRALATAIGKLRRPTVAAWAVNLLAREAEQEVRALLSVGDALRDAQRRLSGAQMRALSTQRQQAVNGLTRKAAQLAAGHGQRLTEPALREIGSTLQAALADSQIGEQVLGGTLSAAASYEGFGPAALVSVPRLPADEIDSGTAEDTGNGKPPAGTSGAAQPDPLAEARRELDETLAEIETGRAALTSARAEHAVAAAELTQLEDRITTLRTELTHAEEQRRFTASTERSTRETLRRADQHMDALERRVEQARNRLSPN